MKLTNGARPVVPRRATAADAAAIRELSRAAYAGWAPVIGREPRPMTADYDRAVIEHSIDLLEEQGTLMALIETVTEADHLLIENIAVRPDQQGRGLGDLLLRHAEQLALAQGFSETRLYTNAAFASNLAFYAKRGYEEYRRTAIAPGGVAVFMRKILKGR
ncbi:MAG TPA: GNAT family N-acetyltransferase [Bradyrhizobium sp.]|jgi:GNAT superfamily N-acetyltransferase|nr:GNAT family N-acetyltransferase [Bradyrhizobium sp.]